MAVGFPRRNRTEVAALDMPRLRNVPLANIGAFLSTNTKKDDKTGETYEQTQVKLSLDWDSGYPMRDSEGELVTDDEGHGRPHYINDGFVTLSGHAKGNFIKILKAIGFQGPRFFDKEGHLRSDIEDTLEVEFGTNKLGESAEGWADLPEYILRSKGGQHAKRDVEVPIRSLRLAGYELLGRVVDLAITVDESGYNRIESYLRSEDFVDLDTPIEPVVSMSLGGPAPAAAARAAAAKAPAKQAQRKAPAVSREEVEDEALFTGRAIDPRNEATAYDDAPETKRAVYVTERLMEAGVPGKDRIAFMQHVLEDEGFASIAGISGDDAKTFKALWESDWGEAGPAVGVHQLYQGFRSQRDHDLPFDANDDEDEDF